MDQAITGWINGPAGENAMLDAVMLALTEFGVPALILLVVLQWWRSGERQHARHTAVVAGLAFLIGLGVNQLILLFLHRMRPYDAGVSHLIISPSADWSFPSDHATASFAIAASFLMSRLKRLSAVLLAIATAVCISRVYVGTHYISDVAGGAVTGIAAAVVVGLLYREGTRLDRAVTSIL